MSDLRQLVGQRVADDNEAMVLALQLARASAEQGEIPVGALVVDDQRVVGIGSNSPISLLDPTAHAEVMAIRDAAARVGNYRLPGMTLYVTVEPCSMCAGAIVHSRIGRVVYGTTEPKAGVACSAEHFFDKAFLNHQVEIVGGVLAEECSGVMTEFFSQRRAGKKRLKRASPPASSE